ncbi:MAG: response regulator, partial [Arenimonas sp.]|nr:response regulator [Arenimonas sp.]
MNDTILGYTAQRTVLVVDDAPDNLTLMAGLLKDHYRVKVAPNGPRAVQIAEGDDPPDLILLDIMMPGMDGYEVCSRLKSASATRHIPVVFLTAMSADEDQKRGFDLGGVDYLTKPIQPLLMLARVRTHLENKLAADMLRDQNAFLEQEVQRRSRDIVALQDAIVLALGRLAESRESSTWNHMLRRQQAMRVLGQQLRRDPAHAGLGEQAVEAMAKAAPLHNIGLVGVPDRIGLAREPLGGPEEAVYRTHPTLGASVLEQAAAVSGAPPGLLDVARDLALAHHEHWDGCGYPAGLSGEAIPLCARLMAVVEAYDEMVFPPLHRAPVPHEEALLHVMAGAGTRFDPAVVEA